MVTTGAPRILLAGGGYVGLYAALALEQQLAPGEADVVLVTPDNYMLYQPLLPEVASGTLEPRHAVVPLRKALGRTQLLAGHLAGLDHDRRIARVRALSGEHHDLGYDHVVIGIGSVTRVLPVPGLAERAVGFKTLPEALHLHNHVLGCLEAAEAARDAETRRRALTFTFVGGGYTGVEALAELEDMTRQAVTQFPTVSPHELRWVLVEAAGRILPTVPERLAGDALRTLRARGIAVHLDTTVESAEHGWIRLSDGTAFGSDTLVWMAGVRPHQLVGQMGFPTNDAGALVVDRCLRVDGVEQAWAAGDNAAVPDGQGGLYPPTAQHARREAGHIAANIAATLRGEQPTPFAYRSPGEIITLGHRKGLAELFGRQLSGFGVWLLRRLYYVAQVPTADRKLRILLDWVVGLPFRREVVNLGSIEHPGAPFAEAAEQSDAG